jgi:periplasmic divalent cation tolerance protein
MDTGLSGAKSQPGSVSPACCSAKKGASAVEEYLQVVTTTETKEDAEKIAGALVEARLVACAQIFGPMKSIYWWKGRIETAEEWLCMVKTAQRIYDDVERRIKAMHPYETPEIVALPLVRGSDDYLQWLQNELKKPYS